MKKIIQINSASSKPKYRQIIDSVNRAIERKSLVKGDKVPSINQICTKFNISRDTVMAAFNEMKSKGILVSQPGKGYYISSIDIQHEEKIFLLFDEFDTCKEILYNSLVSVLKGKGNVDIYFHHFNFKIFKNLILENIGNYTSYIIMPANFDNAYYLISKLPKDKVYILDKQKAEFKNYPVLYQHFELDFYEALVNGLEYLKKYRKLVLVNAGGKEPLQRVKGFEKFCKEYEFNFEVVKTINGVKPALYEAFFLVSDKDLIEMVKMAKNYKYKLGKKFGIVSFNETMLKEVVAGGITTISTDYSEMGKTLATMVMERKTGHVRNPSKLIVRNSL